VVDPIMGEPGARNRIWSSPDAASVEPGPAKSPVPAWGTGPTRASEFVIDVLARAETLAGLAALGFDQAADELADPFRIVVNKGGLYFYSYGDRKHLNFRVGWPSITGLAPTVMSPQRGWLAGNASLNAIEVLALDAQGTPVRFPLVAREPGSGFGAAISASSPGEQQKFIDRIDRFYAERSAVEDANPF
jgi:hypothetical protein